MDRTELYRVSTQILENIINDEKNDNNILFDMDIWDWSQGVALYGIWKYYRLTGERRYLEYLTQWFDTKLNRPIVHNINTMAPLLTLCFFCTRKQAGKSIVTTVSPVQSGCWTACQKPRWAGFSMSPSTLTTTSSFGRTRYSWRCCSWGRSLPSRATSGTRENAKSSLCCTYTISRIKRQGCGATVGRLSAWTIMQAHFGRVEIAGSPSRRPSCRACWS